MKKGAFPKPATVNHDGRDWVIKFWNNPHDKKPPTIVRGSCRKLLLCGAHSFAQNFYLPDHMSADEMCGAVSNKQTSQTETRNADTAGKASVTVGQSLKERLQVDSFERYFERIHDDFAEPIAETDQDTIKATHRGQACQRHFTRQKLPCTPHYSCPGGNWAKHAGFSLTLH